MFYFNRHFNLNYRIARISNPYGNKLPHEQGIGVIDELERRFKSKKPIKIYASLETKRDYIHINDLSLIHKKSIEYLSKTKNNKIIIFNCGYGFGYSVLAVVKNALKIFKFNFIYGKERKGDCSSLIANNKKIKNMLKLNFKIKSLKKILKSAILWEKKYRKLTKKKL